VAHKDYAFPAWAAAPAKINPQTPNAAASSFFIILSPPARSLVASRQNAAAREKLA
jgi:hypothetical protein